MNKKYKLFGLQKHVRKTISLFFIIFSMVCYGISPLNKPLNTLSKSTKFYAAAPGAPGAIVGLTTQCPFAAGQVYSINPVSGATNYAWVVPTGWSITAGQGTTSITVTTGDSSQSGSMYVKASNATGTSNASPYLYVAINALPSVPGSSNPNSPTCTTFTAQWGYSSNATKYFLDLSTESNFSSFLSGYENLDVGNTLSLALTGLNPATTYYYRVRAYSNCGLSNNSPTMSISTLKVLAPATAGAYSANCTGFTAQWGYSANAKTYFLDVATDNNFSLIVAGYDNLEVGNNLNYAITGLNPGTTYYYRVRASGCSTSANSTTMTYATAAIPTAAPLAKGATKLQCNAAQINWDAVTNATGYYIDIATDIAFTNLVNGYNNFYINYANYYAANLPGGTLYYRIRATNACGITTANSNTISFATTGPIGGIVSSAQIICAGTKPNDLSLSGNSSPVDHWESANDINFTNNLKTFATTSAILTAAAIGNLTQNTYFRAVLLQKTPNWCTGYSTPVLIAINANLPATVNISANPGNTICPGTAITFKATSTNGGSSPTYQWKINNQNAGTNSPTFVAENLTDGDKVTVVMTPSANACFTASPATSNLVAIITKTAVYNGSWSVPPSPSLSAEIQTSYTSNTTDGDLDLCALRVTNNAVVNIISGHLLQVRNGVTVDSGSTLTLASDANLIQINDQAINIGNITVERTITPRRNTDNTYTAKEYSFYSSPVKGQNMKAIFGNSASNSVFSIVLNESTNAFVNASANDYNKVGKGFGVKDPNVEYVGNSDKVNATFKGVPNNGEVKVLITLTGTKGWNLIGNPYPSNLDLKTFYDDNKLKMESTIRFWDKTVNDTYIQYGGSYNGYAYALYNADSDLGNPAPGGDAGNNTGDLGNTSGITGQYRYAKVGQGFLIRSLVPKDDISFYNNRRTALSDDVFFGKNAQTEERDLYRIQLVTPSDLTLTQSIVYFQNGTNGFSADDSKHPAASSSDAFYSYAGDEKVIINGRNSFIASDVLHLGLRNFASGVYKIRAVDLGGVFANGQPVYLKDKQLNILTDISQEAYSFTSESGEFTNRFEIGYQPEIVLTTGSVIGKSNIQVYRDAQDLVVRSSAKKITSYELYDMSGRIIMTQKTNSKEVRFNAERFVDGAYVLKGQLENGEQFTKKLRK